MPKTRSAERAQFLADLIVTAVEGGYLTTRVHEYRWFSPDLGGGSAEPGPNGTANAYVTVSDSLEGESNVRVYVGLDEVARGLRKVIDGAKGCEVAPDYRNRLCRADVSNDAGEIDAYDADIVIQAAALGEVIYG